MIVKDAFNGIGPLDFPVSNKAVRRVLIRRSQCPECGEELDTGYECNGCNYDALPELQKERTK